MKSDFSEHFTRLRQDRGLTQQKTAEKLGVTPQAISKWEKGQSLPDVEMLCAIATCFDCTTDYLLGHQPSTASQLDLESVERQSEIEKAIPKDTIMLEIGYELIPMFQEENKNHYTRIHEMRVRIASAYGIMIPLIRIRDCNLTENNNYRILLYETQIAAEGSCDLKKDTIETIVQKLEQVIIQNYDQIINRQLTCNMVSLVRKRYPAAVDGVIPEIVSYRRIQDAIAKLIKRDIPVNRLDFIIGYLEEHENLTDVDIDRLAGLL